MNSEILYPVIVPTVATAAMLAAIETVRLLPRAATFRKRPDILRVLRFPIPYIIAAYFIVLIIGPRNAWRWFSAPIGIPHRDLALAISGIAFAAWCGCLIAFAFRQRLTPELSRGLRFLVYGGFAPLVALTGSGLAFKALALAVAAVAGLWTKLQLRKWKRKTKVSFAIQPWIEEGAPPPTEESLRHALYVQRFIRDRAAEILFGWQWSLALCALAAVLVRATEPVIIGCSLIALLLGLLLSFAALVLPQLNDDYSIII